MAVLAKNEDLNRDEVAAMTEHEISLGEFVKQLAVRLNESQIAMPFKDEEPWHVLFYQLKKEQTPGKPDFLDELQFDWDGPFPRSQELSDYIHALHFTGCVSAANPTYEQLSLNAELGQIWSATKVEGELPKFLDRTLDLAKEEFAA